MATRDFTLPRDDLGYVVIPEYERAGEPLVDVLRKSISRPGAFPLLAAIVRTATGMQLPTAFPPVDHRDDSHELTASGRRSIAPAIEELVAYN